MHLRARAAEAGDGGVGDSGDMSKAHPQRKASRCIVCVAFAEYWVCSSSTVTADTLVLTVFM